MSREENRSNDSVRQRVVEKQKKALNSSESGYAILTLALTIGFFGSSAVLMPSGQSVTGMFSGQTELQQPVVRDTDIRAEKVCLTERYPLCWIQRFLIRTLYRLK